MGLLTKVWQRVSSTKPTKPYLDVEFGIDETAIYKRMKITPYSPDALFTKKKIDIFNQMMLDSEIESSINTLKTIRLSSGWEVIPASESKEHIEQKDFVLYNLENVEGSFDDDLREIMGALEMGVSLNELIWTQAESGKYAGKIILKAIKSKNPKYFNIYTDDFDNIRENGIVNISSFDYGTQYPTEKFVIYSFNKKYENAFGTPRIRSLYDLWYIKKVIERAWAVFLEKYGMPIPVLKHPPNIDETVRTNLLNMLKQFRLETGLLIPQGLELEIKESQARGSSMFIDAFNYINEQIRKTILGQTLTAQQSSVGSYALGKVHYDILSAYIEQLGKDVSEKAIQNQIIRRIIDYNYLNVTEYPKFRFKSLVQDDIGTIIDKYYTGVQIKAIRPIPEDEDKLRDWMKLPPRNETKLPAPIIDKTELPEQELEAKYFEFKEKIFTGVRRRTFTKYEEATDFNGILDVIETNTSDYAIKIADIIKDSVNELIDEIAKKKIIEEKNLSAIDKLHLKNLGEIKSLFNDVLIKIYEQAIRDGRREIISKKKTLKFQAFDLRNMKPKEALDYFKNKSYFMTQMERDYIWRTVKPVIYNTIKTGATLKDFIEQVNKSMEPYYQRGVVDPDEMTPFRLETILRTNLNEAYNEGRRAYFEDPSLEGFVVAYQYSAIMDDRVRPNHAILDGKVFSVTNPVIDRIIPPNGYNCRCVLIPIVEGEEWSEDELPARWEPDKGFDKPGATI